MPYSSNLFFRIYNGDSKASAYPVLLLHGSGGSHLAWPAEVRRLPHHRVLAIDLPGHGKSNTPVCQSLEALQIAIQSFLLDQQIHQVIMVGHSLGAAAALSFASNYPEQVCGLFLLACGSRFNIPLDWFTSLLNADRKKILVKQFSQIVFDPSFPHKRRQELLAPLLLLPTSALLADLGICQDFNPHNKLSRIHCPVYLVNGQNDAVVPPPALQQLAQWIPHASQYVLPDCGHMLLHENTPLVSKILRDFLDKISRNKLF